MIYYILIKNNIVTSYFAVNKSIIFDAISNAYCLSISGYLIQNSVKHTTELLQRAAKQSSGSNSEGNNLT